MYFFLNLCRVGIFCFGKAVKSLRPTLGLSLYFWFHFQLWTTCYKLLKVKAKRWLCFYWCLKPGSPGLVVDRALQSANLQHGDVRTCHSNSYACCPDLHKDPMTLKIRLLVTSSHFISTVLWTTMELELKNFCLPATKNWHFFPFLTL